VNAGNTILNLAFTLELKTADSAAGVNLGLIVGNATSGNIPVSSVPLPSCFWLLGSALAGWCGVSLRKKSAG
jgi:hypothetical protein